MWREIWEEDRLVLIELYQEISKACSGWVLIGPATFHPAQKPAHSASVRSHQGPSQETESKENPVKASNRKNPIPPAGVSPLKTRRKVYWATVGNRRPNVVSLVIDNKFEILARPRPLICHTYDTQKGFQSIQHLQIRIGIHNRLCAILNQFGIY